MNMMQNKIKNKKSGKMYFQQNLLIILSILSLIVFIYAIYYNLSGWYFIFFLSTIGFINCAAHIDEKNTWNGGICEKTNTPWEFKKSSILSDESIIYVFESDNEIYLSHWLNLNKLKKQYKGMKKIAD